MDSSVSSKFHYFVIACFGALIGASTSFVVNCALIEVSINEFFAVYFGVLFILIAAILFWRIRGGAHPFPALLTTFATLVLTAGISCFFLEKSWFIHMHWIAKIPMYTLLGIATSFAVLFSLVDLINYITDVFSLLSTPLVDSEKQVYLVVFTAVFMGFAFGLTFGLLDVEDESMARLSVAMRRERSYCYPMGAVIGAVAAVINQTYREDSFDFQKHEYDNIGL